MLVTILSGSNKIFSILDNKYGVILFMITLSIITLMFCGVGCITMNIKLMITGIVLFLILIIMIIVLAVISVKVGKPISKCILAVILSGVIGAFAVKLENR